MSGNAKKRLKKMEALYNCTVCLGLPMCNIYQCPEGHLICADCFHKIPTLVNCPTCRTPFPAPPIRNRIAEQATEYLELPCKFSLKGCKEVGARSIMRAHIEQCVFGNILCPCCKETMRLEGIVNHLKNTHKCVVSKGIVHWPTNHHKRAVNLRPVLETFDGRSFLLNANKKDFIFMFWVTILGSEEDAHQYDVKMSATSVDGNTKVITKGKVYSIEKGKSDVVKGTDGILEISPKMATKLGKTRRDGTFCINIDYNIVRK